MASGVLSLVAAMAEKLRDTFGEGNETSPERWRCFKLAFENVKALNLLKVDQSDEAKIFSENEKYRARKLVAQLRGEPLLWAMQSDNAALLDDDEALLKALGKRYADIKARSAYVTEFEECVQKEGESLEGYLGRLQQIAASAFDKHPADVRQERVLSRFIRTVRPLRLREELLVYGLYDDSDQVRSYSDVLSKARHLQSNWEAARGVIVPQAQSACAAAVVPSSLCAEIEKLQQQVAALQGQFKAASYREPGGSSQNAKLKNWKCHYCHRSDHRGGWRKCPLRRKQQPSWTPTSRGF